MSGLQNQFEIFYNRILTLEARKFYLCVLCGYRAQLSSEN